MSMVVVVNVDGIGAATRFENGRRVIVSPTADLVIGEDGLIWRLSCPVMGRSGLSSLHARLHAGRTV